MKLFGYSRTLEFSNELGSSIIFENFDISNYVTELVLLNMDIFTFPLIMGPYFTDKKFRNGIANVDILGNIGDFEAFGSFNIFGNSECSQKSGIFFSFWEFSKSCTSLIRDFSGLPINIQHHASD